MDDLAAKVDLIPTDGEWWKQSGRETYLRLAQRLIDKGFTEDEALEVLQDAYYAAAEEFGN